jgi:hypothetical protein
MARAARVTTPEIDASFGTVIGQLVNISASGALLLMGARLLRG